MNKKQYTVRDAYNSVFRREHTYAIFKKMSNDKANRCAAKLAVKYAWIEFNVIKEMKNGIK